MNEEYDVNVTLNGRGPVSGTIKLTRSNVSYCMPTLSNKALSPSLGPSACTGPLSHTFISFDSPIILCCKV